MGQKFIFSLYSNLILFSSTSEEGEKYKFSFDVLFV